MESLIDDQLRKIATERILSKRDQLVRDSSEVKREQMRLAERDREIERELAECKAAAKFFGIVFEESPTEADIARARSRALADRIRARAAQDAGDQVTSDGLLSRARMTDSHVSRLVALRETATAQGALSIVEAPVGRDGPVPEATMSTAAKMPRVRDVALDQLRAAGPGGLKASQIRQYILTTYAHDLHEKTVGMTLYRLSGGNLVHRSGQTWFYGPQVEQSLPASAGNPGVDAPGPTHVAV